MKKILAQDIEDGMLLAEDLAGPNGNIILPKGVFLKNSLVPRLIGWGVQHVIVEGEDNQESNEEISIEEYKDHLSGLFIDGIKNEKNNLLFQLLIQLKESDS